VVHEDGMGWLSCTIWRMWKYGSKEQKRNCVKVRSAVLTCSLASLKLICFQHEMWMRSGRQACSSSQTERTHTSAYVSIRQHTYALMYAARQASMLKFSNCIFLLQIGYPIGILAPIWISYRPISRFSIAYIRYRYILFFLLHMTSDIYSIFLASYRILKHSFPR
jgi:hypothetical protein